jgi:glucose-1-phosphate thymidylyltransferase
MRRESPGAALTKEQARAAAQGSKAMMPVGRPFLDYVLSALADAGITQICLVVPPDHEAMKRYYETRARPTRFALAYAVQVEPRGTADAVLAAREFAGDEPFLILNGDNYYPAEAYRALLRLKGPGTIGFEPHALVEHGNIEPDRIRRYALLQVNDEGILTDVVEKPDPSTFDAMAAARLVSMNLWSLSPLIFDACAAVRPSDRGELELPDAVRHAIRHSGLRLRVVRLAEGVLDLASRQDVAAVEHALRDVTVAL